MHVQMGRKVILVAINDRNMKTCHVQDHMSYRMTDRQTDRLAQKAAYMYTHSLGQRKLLLNDKSLLNH